MEQSIVEPYFDVQVELAGLPENQRRQWEPVLRTIDVHLRAWSALGAQVDSPALIAFADERVEKLVDVVERMRALRDHQQMEGLGFPVLVPLLVVAALSAIGVGVYFGINASDAITDKTGGRGAEVEALAETKQRLVDEYGLEKGTRLFNELLVSIGYRLPDGDSSFFGDLFGDLLGFNGVGSLVKYGLMGLGAWAAYRVVKSTASSAAGRASEAITIRRERRDEQRSAKRARRIKAQLARQAERTQAQIDRERELKAELEEYDDSGLMFG